MAVMESANRHRYVYVVYLHSSANFQVEVFNHFEKVDQNSAK